MAVIEVGEEEEMQMQERLKVKRMDERNIYSTSASRFLSSSMLNCSQC